MPINYRAYDPHLAEEAALRSERDYQRRLAMQAEQGQIIAGGISGLGDAASSMVTGATDSYFDGKKAKQDKEAHEMRKLLAEEDLQDQRTTRAILDSTAEEPSQAQTLREQVIRSKIPDKTPKPDVPTAYQTEMLKREDEKLRLQAERDKHAAAKPPPSQEITPYQREMLKRQDEHISLSREKMAQTKPTSKQEFDNLPVETQQQIKTISTKVGNYKTAASIVKSSLVEFQKAKSKDDKIRIGQGMLKEMNSLVGQDAVGAEEVKRLGNALEYQIANLSGPGPIMGRDLPGFERQAFSAIQKMDNAANISQNEIDRLYGRPNARAAQEPVDPALKQQGGALAGEAPKRPVPTPSDVDMLNKLPELEKSNDPRAPALRKKLTDKGLL